jgi:hypothetical protein
MNNNEAAQRSLEDRGFAQMVLSGEEDYPEVRDAILADLWESTEQAGQSETEGFAAGAYELANFETNFVSASNPAAACYVRYYPKMPADNYWDQWQVLYRPNLTRMAGY